MPHKVIIDTDIGEDIDDILVTAFALRSAEFDVVGITTVDGDTQARSRIARKLTQVCGRPEVPVAAGYVLNMPQVDPDRVGSESVTQFNLAPDEEGLPPASELRADELIAALASEHPGEISLLTIGSMTNAGQAFVRFPRETAQLRQVVTNGGNFGRGRETSIGWNLRYDPIAAAIVSRGPVQWVLLPENAMGPAGLRAEDVERLRASAQPPAQLLFQAIQLWRKNKSETDENSVPHVSDLNVFAYLLGGWLEATPGLAWITAPPRGRMPELRVDFDEVGPHLLGGVLPGAKGAPLRDLLMERLLTGN